MGKGGEQNNLKVADGKTLKKAEKLKVLETAELRKWAKAYGVKEPASVDDLLIAMVTFFIDEFPFPIPHSYVSFFFSFIFALLLF